MTNGRMCWVILHLLMLMTLSCRSSAENDTGVPVLCPKHQAAFRGSCFEFVGLQCSFFSAQAWCEVSGGHLAFIPDEDTQDFLQTHLDSEKDMWLGVAPSSSTNQQYSVTDEGPLSWLDGSPMTYSKWVSSPQQGAACGHIRRNSGFQWEATRDCNKKLHFICQFESGRSIVCAGRSTALQCGSGQVLMIDGGFYGRNNIHYCRSRFSPTTSTDQECGWVDVVESVTAHCQGRQICQIAEVINCFDEVCPQRKSYLSVDYHCRDGLTLTMNTVAAVFDDVTITVKWFIHLPQENLSCRLNTGDGQVVHLHSPEGLESSVVHKYTHPGTFVVAVECRGSEIRYQEIITIQEPVTEIGVIRCYAGNWSFYESNCKAQDGEAFQIQMEVNAGTNVVYRIQNGEKLLSGLSVVRGKVPQNITVTPGMMQHLGPGCHRLTLYASNMVTFPHVSRDLQVCILEKVARLHASILTERDDCSDSPDITLGVSLERGTPVLLLFSLTGDNSSFSETREMNTRKGIFLIEHPIQVYKKYTLKTSGDDTTTTKKPATTDTSAGAGNTQDQTTNNSDGLSCNISPSSGTVLDPFTITCNTEKPCPNCQYCLTAMGKYTSEVKAVFLPLGDSSASYNLVITATAETGSFVRDSKDNSGFSVDDLKNAVINTVDQLKNQDLLSGEIIGQMFSSVANTLNGQSDESQKEERQQVNALSIMLKYMWRVDKNVWLTSRTHSAHVAWTNLRKLEIYSWTFEIKSFVRTCDFLHMDKFTLILNKLKNISVSDALFSALDKVQSILLAFQEANREPGIIQQGHISVYFGLYLHLQMLSLDKVPFPLNEGGNVSGVVGDLSLTTKNGSGIHVENLSEDIEILLPRPAGEQVNTSVLYLGNYSTTVIDVPSGNTTLVLKMVPSMEPLPFKVFLGYMEYPTEANHVAMTQMPQEGTTKEERYTWLLSPESLKGHTGTHYLVVRPIVGPGIKSINASLSITSITASCKYWNESLSAWYDHGCRVGVNTTHSATQCLCNHLTFFGSSFFVTPNLVDPSRTAELFATFAENPVVVCFVGALFVTYLLVVVWARRKDIQDTAKVKVTVLADNDPMDEYRYLLSVCTGHRVGASTSSQVTVTLLGAEGNSEPHHLTDPKKPVFERGGVDMFLITTPFCLGDLQSLRLWHNNSGSHPSWYVGNVIVQDFQTEQKWHFLCNSWLAIDMEDCCLDKVFPASTEEDLKRFSNLFFMKTTKDFSDGHLWFSVVNRPVSSTFTRVQRVSCCFSLLLCTMLTSIMFYGIPTDPSEQTMDLGHFEFTWQQFMIGVQSSLIMFPVNILIVSIFRNTRPREMSCCRRQTKKPKALEQDSSTQKLSSHAATPNMNANDTLDTIIKDITRIAHTLSKNVKSNIPCTESDFKPEQQIDINAILPVMEDFIKQNNKSSDNVQAKTQPQLPESSASVHPAQTEKGIQKKSNKIQYLYRQLCHIELSLQSLSSFPSPHSYSQALQQVQALKGVLEEQLFTSNSNKRVCCQGMLPWWFIFVGWLLVIGTSVVSGYFTMLYGLNFGKERSISWLVSMIVSFFQSLLLIQPLKVLCIAIFFALVIKKVDEEDFQNVAFVKSDCKDQQMTRRDAGLYVPPPPADIEKMRRNRILEQKAFALLREILIYMGFLWMLLLVAYGQRDPNAFLLNKHIRKSFSAGISSSMSVGDVFAWANKSLLRNLYGVYPGFITDGNSKLVGNARLRQLRVQKSSCQIADSMLKLVPDCHAPYSWEVEDMGSYELGWNHSVSDNMSTSTSSPWKYQTQAQLRSSSFWGKTVIYRGGGFSVELGPDLQNASSTLEYLFRNKWLDMYTRAVFVEFTVYNANVNLFCVATLLLETTAVGAFQFQSQMQSVRLYQSTGGLYIFVMVAEIIYLLFILHYMFLQGKLMKQQRCSYFKNKWNLLELTIILLSWSALAVFIVRNVLGDRDITYYQNHKDQFVSFLQTATVDSLLQYLIAFLVLLATVKMWHLLRLNPKMNMITATLQRAWSDISDFLVVIVIMLAAYSIACNVIYGWEISSYKTLMDAVLTIISLQIGIFNYNEVLNYSPVLGGFLIGSCIVFMSFVVLNLLVSVILVAFNQEQIYHKVRFVANHYFLRKSFTVNTNSKRFTANIHCTVRKLCVFMH
uniref:Polycystic kidney disease 1 like 2a n=1 Tax=Amphiprion ocellaris TaxID=80972 RepID=A0AAQ6AF67_AMPOC